MRSALVTEATWPSLCGDSSRPRVPAMCGATAAAGGGSGETGWAVGLSGVRSALELAHTPLESVLHLPFPYTGRQVGPSALSVHNLAWAEE